MSRPRRPLNHILWCGLAAALLCVLGGAPAWAAFPRAAIAFAGTDGNIYYCVGGCKKLRCITCAAEAIQVRAEGPLMPSGFKPAERIKTIYGWPTFSPGGRRIAYMSSTRGGRKRSFGLHIYDVASRQASEIFESPSEQVIYMYWLADGRHLSFLLNEPRGLSLMLAEPRQGAPLRIVTTGAPLYFDWRRGSTTLALHAVAPAPERTEKVSLITVTPTDQRVDKVLSLGRAPFKTPCWSPDTKHLAYVVSEDGQASLVVSGPRGQQPRSMASLEFGESAFVWGPHSRYIAYSTSIIPGRAVYHGVKLLDVSDGSIRRITSDAVAAYHFSPDGRRMLVLSVPRSKPYLTWKVIDLRTGKTRTILNFVSTGDATLASRYFDQLARSHSVWSPDSRAFVYAGLPMGETPPNPMGLAPPPRVWIVPINGDKPRAIGEGTLAFFAPAPE